MSDQSNGIDGASAGAGNGTSGRSLMPTLVAESAPDFTPNMPGDVWACPWDGCLHKVYSASSDQSQDLMRSHYQQHTKGDERLDLVRKEAGMNLPVGYVINLPLEQLEAPRHSGLSIYGNELTVLAGISYDI